MSTNLSGKPIDELFKPFIEDGQLNRSGVSIDPDDRAAVGSARKTFLSLYSSVHTMLFHGTSADRPTAWSVNPSAGQGENTIIVNREADLIDYALFLGVIRHCVVMNGGDLDQMRTDAASLSALSLINRLSDSELMFKQMKSEQDINQSPFTYQGDKKENQI